MLRNLFITFLSLLFPPILMAAPKDVTTSPEATYEALQRQLARGWNTWDARSVLTHAFMPYACAVDLGLEDSTGHRRMKFLIGDRGNDAPLLQPGPHTYDGGYSCITVSWHGQHLKLETAAQDNRWVLLVTPESDNAPATFIVQPKTLWMRGNTISIGDRDFSIGPKDKSLVLHGHIAGAVATKQGNILKVSTEEQFGMGVDASRQPLSLDTIRTIITAARNGFDAWKRQQYGSHYDAYNAMQSVLGWNSFYDPTTRRVITPVSRIWSTQWFASSDYGGFTLFCWDTYFAAMMIGLDDKALAYANLVEITQVAKEVGFVPNCYYSNGFKSRDRTQPAVGSLATWTLYKKYKDRWLLELVYPQLLLWNRWNDRNRRLEGLIALGCSPYEKVTYFRSEYDSNTRYGAILESGLDNSPMYDEVRFDTITHLTDQQDVGMSSLYVMDCHYLSLIARELGYKKDAKELERRGAEYGKNLQKLWDDKDGIYYNYNFRMQGFNKRLAPTSFYPLLAHAATQEQARRMVSDHLLNPEEFWGEYILPSIARKDGAFMNQEYWRGRIWAPLNFLVYLGLREYGFPEVRREFAKKSEDLLLKSWLSHGYVFENYNAMTGEGDDVERSDKFYHWGGLLGYIALIEAGLAE